MTQSFQPVGRPGRTLIDPLATTFEDLDISLFDLFRANILAGRSDLSGRTFRNCHIDGPAVMLVSEGVRFERTNFGQAKGDPATLLLRPVSQSLVTGAIPVQDCAFIGCRFLGVGFTGSEALIQEILSLGKQA
jgi:hypothetical protein